MLSVIKEKIGNRIWNETAGTIRADFRKVGNLEQTTAIQATQHSTNYCTKYVHKPQLTLCKLFNIGCQFLIMGLENDNHPKD